METVDVQAVSDCPTGDELCVVRSYESEVIIVPVLLIGVSCLVGGCILWMTCRRKKGRLLAGSPRAETPASDPGLRERPPPESLRSDPTLGPWQVSQDRMVGGLKWIARGRYGDIYRSRLLPDGAGKERTVVVKELRDAAGPGLAWEFLSRVRFQAVLGQHPHLVQMVGWCTRPGAACLMLESLGHGDLLHFLWLCRKDVVTMQETPYDLTEAQVYGIAGQVASALEFLHTKGLVHGNVGARNVLLGEDLTAKLCGLHIPFKIQTSGSVPSQGTAPQKWQSPETLMKRPPTSKSDVWSFGILLYEMITLGAPPYGDLPPSGVLQYLQRGRRMSQPATCRSSLYRLMSQCWEWRPGDRPGVPELRKRLRTQGRAADDRVVIRVPHRIEAEAYALVTGTSLAGWVQDYTVL